MIARFLFQLGRCVLRKRSEHLFDQFVRQKKAVDVIIVPGVPFKYGSWDTMMKLRVLWSYVLYKGGYAQNVIYSGGAVYTPYYEAQIMGLYAIELGIPAEHIFYDTLAEHSTENVFFSHALALKSGFSTVAIATDPGQSFLLERFTKRRFSPPIIPIPMVEHLMKDVLHLPLYIDATEAYDADFVSLIKRENFFKRFAGTLGQNIPWSAVKVENADKL